VAQHKAFARLVMRAFIAHKAQQFRLGVKLVLMRGVQVSQCALIAKKDTIVPRKQWFQLYVRVVLTRLALQVNALSAQLVIIALKDHRVR